MTIAFIILSIILTILSGFAKAITDLSEDGKLKFTPERYWLKSKSWVNKWKCSFNKIPLRDNNDKLTESFKGSSTIFVAFTDAWHLFNAIYYYSTAGACIFIGYVIAVGNVGHLCLLLLLPFQRVVFHLFYNSKILRK